MDLEESFEIIEINDECEIFAFNSQTKMIKKYNFDGNLVCSYNFNPHFKSIIDLDSWQINKNGHVLINDKKKHELYLLDIGFNSLSNNEMGKNIEKEK